MRVESPQAGRLRRVSLNEVPLRTRELASRRLREKRWDDELRPDTGYRPTMKQRAGALLDAVQLEAAARHPTGVHFVSEEAARRVLG